MSRIIVGMSGGVDSAVCAYLLRAAGHEVIGVTLKTLSSDTRCCEINEARLAADQMGIPYYVKSVMSEFCAYVTEPFVREYLAGRTPNPCTACNRRIKWDGLLQMADALGAEYVATGHYAMVGQLSDGRYSVRQAESKEKDQTYFLYQLSQSQLSRTIMPLGKLDKPTVRRIAKAAGIPTFNKPDSQEICFLEGDENYADYIEEHADAEAPALQPGHFVTEDGTVLGEHRGLIHYTVGQRKGLGLAMGAPVYVKELRPQTNEVVVSSDAALYASSLVCAGLHFMSIPDLPVGQTHRAIVKIRYRHVGTPALLTRVSPEALRVDFDAPVRAVSPGQAAVFYEDGYVLGGGLIVR